MSKEQETLEKVKDDFTEVVKTIDGKFGENYASKNPGLVQHLLDKIQQYEDRILTKSIHNV